MNTAGSRLAWSMARDRAFPFSDYFAQVNKRFTMPLRAMVGVLVLNLLVGLLVLGSDLAFYAIIFGWWRCLASLILRADTMRGTERTTASSSTTLL